MKVSIIIPTLNEEAALPATLTAIACCVPAPYEVIVVDGGSTDRTTVLARSMQARVLSSAHRGRGAQMNLGAKAATGDVLYFVHADTIIPPSAIARIASAVQAGYDGGGFLRRFDSRSTWLRITCWFSDFRSRWWGYFLGDQTLFATQAAFNSVGGYREWQAFEDPQFARDLRRIGKTTTLHPPVLSSARRFNRLGPWKQTWVDFQMTCQYFRRKGWE